MEARTRGGRGRILLLILGGLLTTVWVLYVAVVRDWVLVDEFFLIPLVCLIIPFWISLFIGALAYAFVKLFRRQLSVRDLLPTVAIVVGFLVGWYFPSKPQAVLWLHRVELTRSIEQAITECRETGDDFRLPPTSFYDDGHVYCTPSGVESIDFVIDSFGTTFDYMPRLRFVSSPLATRDHGYGVRGWYWCRKIEPHWYCCSRWVD